MKTILNIFYPGSYSNSVSIAVLLLRLAAGIFMITHGKGKLNMLFGDAEIHFADPIGMGETASLVLTVFAEVFCSLLLILGIGTRFFAIPLIISMLVAAIIVHSGDPFAKKEMALLYSVVYTAILFTGAGKYSLDHLIFNRTGKKF